MKLSYYPETDQLYIDLCDGESVESEEDAPGFVLDFEDHKPADLGAPVHEQGSGNNQQAGQPLDCSGRG